jgi:hypothetical protein
MNNQVSLSLPIKKYHSEETSVTVDKHISELSDEVFLLIFSNLKELSDLASIAKVDRRWNQLAKEFTLAKFIYNFVKSKSEDNFNFCKKDRVVIIDHSLDVGSRVIKIAAYSIFIAPDVILKAKEIEFYVRKEIYCLGELRCHLFNTVSDRKSFIHIQGPNYNISPEFKASSKF